MERRFITAPIAGKTNNRRMLIIGMYVDLSTAAIQSMKFPAMLQSVRRRYLMATEQKKNAGTTRNHIPHAADLRAFNNAIFICRLEVSALTSGFFRFSILFKKSFS